MLIRLTRAEKNVATKLKELKKKSTSHSPSPAMLRGIGVNIRHDFCYLSNPYATELFLRYFKRDFKDGRRLHSLVEQYPSQNRALAEKLAESPLVKGALHSDAGGLSNTPRLADSAPPLLRGIGVENIFVGNGATEVIQAVLQNADVRGFDADKRRKILVPVPTFSPYLEFVPTGVRVVHHRLRKEENFRLNLKELFADVRKEKPDTVVIINPNNPEGGDVNANELQHLLAKLRHVPTVIVDESFSHFAQGADVRGYKNADRRGFPDVESVAPLVKKFPNLVVIKSFSKDFGIAGLRLGYAVMSEKRVSALLERGYLWNVSGFGEYFLDLLNDKQFLKKYEVARLKAIRDRDGFFKALSRIKGIQVYPSRANMFLIELLNGTKAGDLLVRLLVRHGIYVRTCYDKVGLSGEFIRVASRKAGENRMFVLALKDDLSA